MNRSTRLRPATADDVRAIGELPPAWFVDGWVEGDVLVDGDGRILGYGIVTQDTLGRFWGWVRRGPASAVTMHRGALRLIAAVRSSGAEMLCVYCNQDIAGAAEWLARLGFVQSDGETPQGRVWVCRFSP
jgi:hypothetical protein